MTEELLAEIFANPRNTGARLVYADYLLERGDERGELMQLECARGPITPERAARRDELRKRLIAEWKALDLEVTLDRGFVRCVHGSSDNIVAHHERIAREPVTELRLRKLGDLTQFATLDVLARVEALVLWSGLNEANARVLAASTKLARLRKLQLGIDEGHTAIKHAAWADQLRCLTVYASGSRRPFELADYAFPNLTTIELEGCRVGEHAGALAAQLPHLQSVKLARNELGVEGVRALAAARLARLSDLVVYYDLPTDDGVRALAEASGWPALRRLSLPHDHLGDTQVESLVQGAGCATLVDLDLSYNPFGDRAARAIAEIPTLRGLRFLNVAYSKVTIDGLRMLAGGLPRLERLSIGPLVGDEAKAAFAHRRVKLQG